MADGSPRHFIVMDFEATCETDEIGILSVCANSRISTSKHRLNTGDHIKCCKESRNWFGGEALLVGGVAVADESDFFVRAVDDSTLELYSSKEDAVSGRGLVCVEAGSGKGSMLRDQASVRVIDAVDVGSQLRSANHRLCTGNAAKYVRGCGAPLLEAGRPVTIGTNFFVRATNSDTLQLFRSKKDAENNVNPAAFDLGSGAKAELEVRAGVHWVPEIIEFPGVLLDASTMQPISEFRELVRPTETPQLSDFATKLTSITQAKVDTAEPLPIVLERFSAWLAEHHAEDALPVTCGDWDLAIMLSAESKRKGLGDLVPSCLRRWCNIKQPFGKAMDCRAPGMDGMLRTLNLELVGHHHLGIDDCRNIARILQEVVRRFGATIEVTTEKKEKPAKAEATAAKPAQPTKPTKADKKADKPEGIHVEAGSRRPGPPGGQHHCGALSLAYLSDIGLPVWVP
jgi:ERI1 exoribonuclease 3